MPAESPMSRLIERSSLGTRAARKVRANTPPAVAERIARQSRGQASPVEAGGSAKDARRLKRSKPN